MTIQEAIKHEDEFVRNKEQSLAMTEDQKKLLLKALDALWGGLDSAHDVAAMLLDSQDGRIENMSEALCESQDAILALKESFGVGKI